jgi:hypothetical protein
VARLSHTLDPEKRPVEAPDVETISAAPVAKAEKKVAAPKPSAKAKPAAKKAAKPAVKKGKE